MTTLIEAELQADRARWGYPYEMWEEAIEDIKTFSAQRQTALASHYKKHFRLSAAELGLCLSGGHTVTPRAERKYSLTAQRACTEHCSV